MKKKIRNTAIFFTILYWLIIYLVLLKKNIKNFNNISHLELLGLILGSLIIILISKFLVPLFEFVLYISKKIGSIIFSILSGFIFFFILTPISMVLKIRGKQFLQYKIDKAKSTYYEEYEKSEDITKQF